MLTSGIHDCVSKRRRSTCSSTTTVRLLARGVETAGQELRTRRVVFRAGAVTSCSTSRYSEEVFGASSVIVRCADEAELFEVARTSGRPAHCDDASHRQDDALAAPFAACRSSARPADYRERLADRRRGRRTRWFMAARYPATSDGRSTSVGHAGDRTVPAASVLPGFAGCAAAACHCVATVQSLPHRFDGV